MATGQLVCACLNNILNTGEDTPTAAQLTYRSICAWWNLHLGRPDSAEVHRFSFFYRDEAQVDQPWFIVDDGTLRYAWRLWLSLEDIEMPFVLFVEDGQGN